MNFKNTLQERSQRQKLHTVWFCVSGRYRKDKFIDAGAEQGLLKVGAVGVDTLQGAGGEGAVLSLEHGSGGTGPHLSKMSPHGPSTLGTFYCRQTLLKYSW